MAGIQYKTVRNLITTYSFTLSMLCCPVSLCTLANMNLFETIILMFLCIGEYSVTWVTSNKYDSVSLRLLQ